MSAQHSGKWCAVGTTQCSLGRGPGSIRQEAGCSTGPVFAIVCMHACMHACIIQSIPCSPAHCMYTNSVQQSQDGHVHVLESLSLHMRPSEAVILGGTSRLTPLSATAVKVTFTVVAGSSSQIFANELFAVT
jgi:hypothetical protein